MQDVAIIGGGASGVLSAIHLLRHDPDIRVFLIEAHPKKLARGVAYSTESPHHLLNVRAFGMSAWHEAPNDFLEWLSRTYGDRFTRNDFVPRQIFGQYLHESLLSVAETDGDRLLRVQGEAVELHRQEGGWKITLASGSEIEADQTVLALGNFPPQSLRPFVQAGLEPPRYYENPWTPPLDTLIGLPSICLIGTGLTAVDIVVDLLQREYKGQIHAISRNGMMPMAHVEPGETPNQSAPAFSGSVSGQMRDLRNWMRDAGSSWQSAFDTLRPSTQTWWKSLEPAQQRRFLRHLKTHWDVHRHRIDPKLHALLTAAMERGQFTIHPGRIASVVSTADGVAITVDPKAGNAPETVTASTVLNCTGPSSDIRRVDSRLVANLLESGTVRTDVHRLGFETTEEGRLLDGSGTEQPSLWAVGPLRKGTLWESTAMREIREQAHALARNLAISEKNP